MCKVAIAIDGPAGSGKSTVARIVAERLGYIYVDTGAMYRAVALKALRLGVSWADGPAVARVTRASRIELDGLTSGSGGGRQARVLLDGEDVSEAIRAHHVSKGASDVAVWAEVRSALVEKQREMARVGSVVMDGRDIGTVVLPGAQVKVFLTADIEERVRRRASELAGRGVESDPAMLRSEIEARDINDSTRSVGPLCQAPDAVLIDTSNLSIEQVVARIIELAETARNRMRQGQCS